MLKTSNQSVASEYIEIGLLVCEKKIAVLVFLLLSVITLYHLSPFHLETQLAGRLMQVKNHINNTLATAKRWQRPLNRGGR